jgi:hypothetical protein
MAGQLLFGSSLQHVTGDEIQIVAPSILVRAKCRRKQLRDNGRGCPL